MSRAFVKESDGAEALELPELQVSPHLNLVTPAGLRQIGATVERLQTDLSDARAEDDLTAIARIKRDLRYWTARLRTAEVIVAQTPAGTVRFGSTVALQAKGREQIEYQIVGEDEADPANGKISYVSPVARKLIGAAVGEVAALADGEVEIIGIR